MRSIYTPILEERIEEIRKLVAGEVDFTDLSFLKDVSANAPGNTSGAIRKYWVATGFILDDGTLLNGVQTLPLKIAHAKAVGACLYSLGYTGPFYITQDLKLVLKERTSLPERYSISEMNKNEHQDR